MSWLWLLMACSTTEPAAPLVVDGQRTLSLIYTADVHGEIEPCG